MSYRRNGPALRNGPMLRNRPALRIALALCFLAAGLTMARAEDVTVQGLKIEHPWARASAGATGAVYLRIKNKGNLADALVGVSTPAAQRAQVHSMTNENGIMKMRRVDSLEIPPGAAVTLEPGHYHVMLFDLTAPLKAGTSFPLTLKFRKAGDVAVTVSVEPPKAGPMQGMPPGEGDKMPGMD